MKWCVALYIAFFYSQFAFAETFSFSIDEDTSSFQYWPPFGFPLDGCGDSGEGPCAFGISGSFDFESDVENNSQAFFDVDVSLSGDENLLSDSFVAGRAASWMSNLRFSSQGDGRFSSVGSIEVNLSRMSLSLTGFQDARPGDGTAVLFDVHGFLVPEPPLSWIALVILALPFLRRQSGRIGRVFWPNSGARTRNSLCLFCSR